MKNVLEEERFVVVKTEGADIFVCYASREDLTEKIKNAIDKAEKFDYDTDEIMVTEALKSMGFPFEIMNVPVIVID